MFFSSIVESTEITILMTESAVVTRSTYGQSLLWFIEISVPEILLTSIKPPGPKQFTRSNRSAGSVNLSFREGLKFSPTRGGWYLVSRGIAKLPSLSARVAHTSINAGKRKPRSIKDLMLGLWPRYVDQNPSSLTFNSVRTFSLYSP